MSRSGTHIDDCIEIGAPVDRVWALTLNVEAWPSFSPTMTSVERLEEGPLVVGSTARVRQPGQQPAVWTVTMIDPPVLFEWKAKVFGVALTAAHRIEKTESGCRQTLSVDLAGPGSKAFAFVLGRAISKSLVAENAAFKERAERDAAQ